MRALSDFNAPPRVAKRTFARVSPRAPFFRGANEHHTVCESVLVPFDDVH